MEASAKRRRTMEELPPWRPWDATPNAALVNIFCRVPIKDRFQSLPLVCKSWADASRDSRCWASMIADSHYTSSSAFDDAFIKESYPYCSSFADPFDWHRNVDPCFGVHKLQALIDRAGGGTEVTSLYFFPFLTSTSGPPNDDALLRLIAQSCPNLRHLSFHGSYVATEGAVLEVIYRCRKLELIDFAGSPYFTPKVLKEVSACCPNLRGIRGHGILDPSIVSILSAGFPNLRILNLSHSTIVDKDLLDIVTKRTGLQYLDITNCPRLRMYMYIIKGALSQIAEIIYD